MKRYFSHPIFHLKPEHYVLLILFLAPFSNFLSGINLDIYSPSMPAISDVFHATVVATKNTIAVCVLGWSLGAIIFGILFDSIGRKKILVGALLFYLLSTLAALFCHTIHQLMLVRFMQGFCIAAISVGCRVLIVDTITGKRYAIAILYTSIGYGLGPIIGPFIGGLLQHYIGWQANFIALSVLSFLILILMIIFLKETVSVRHPLKIKHIANRCYTVLSDKIFMAGVIIGGITQIQIMLYPTIGPFIVERELHQTVLIYGNSALIVGLSFLFGSLVNRVFLKYLSVKAICDIGFGILIIGILIAFLFSILATMDLTTVILPLILIGISPGMIFPNVVGKNLKQFSHMPGVALAIQTSVLLLISSIGIFLISHVYVQRLLELALIILVLGLFEIILFYGFYRASFKSTSQ